MISDLVSREFKQLKENTTRSRELFAETRKRVPFGVSSNYRHNEPYPFYFSKGRESRIWDADGNEYLDFNMAYGVLVAGHSHPKLVDGVKERIGEGPILGFEFEDTHKLADIVCRRFGLDMVRFSSTGLEVTHHALRFARAYTGREKIVKFEGCYHGSHDQLLVSVKPKRRMAGHMKSPVRVPAGPGIPRGTVEMTLVAQFNDIDSVDMLLQKHGDEVAAIIIEPIPMNMGFVMPNEGFLQELRRLADEYNVVLIFDEVKTAGKYYGGAYERFGVKPDMVVMGKAIAGGFPLSAVGGREHIMADVGPGLVAHAGTFNTNPLSVTAGIITLSDILTQTAMKGVQSVGDQLVKGYSDIVEDLNLGAVVQADGLSGTLYFTDKRVENWRDFLRHSIGKWSFYYASMMNRGIIPMAFGYDEQWTVSVQHSREDVRRHVESFGDVAPHLKAEVDRVSMVEAV